MPGRITAQFWLGPAHGKILEIANSPIFFIPVFSALNVMAVGEDFEAPISSRFFEARYNYYGPHPTRNLYIYKCSNLRELVEAGWRPECGQHLCGARPCEHDITRPINRTRRVPFDLVPPNSYPPEVSPGPDSHRFNAAKLGADKEIEEWNKFVAEIKEKKGTK